MRAGRLRATLGLVVLAAWGVAGAPARASDWPQPAIPLIYQAPGYVSPNDTTGFTSRDYDLADKNEAELAVQALTAFTDARRVVGSWHQSLLQAEAAFWDHFHRSGEVDDALRNELAYWIGKREEWTAAFGGMRVNLSLQGNSDLAKILEFQFGANDERFFGLPDDWRASSDGPVAQAPGLAPGDADYPRHMGEWSRYSYMTACPCSPKFSADPVERIGYLLAHPSGDVRTAAELVARVREAARGGRVDATALEAYVRDAVDEFGFVISSRYLLAAVLEGDADPLPGLLEEAFLRLSGEPRDALGIVDRARLSPAKDRIDAGALAWMRGRPVLLNGQSVEAVQACIADNWDTTRQYVFETNPDRAVRLVGIPTMETVKFRQSLGYAAAIACTSGDGLADVRVDDFLAEFGFFD